MMLYKREGWPEEDELVVCNVTSVQYNSVFCDLDEYPGKGGMIHISEVTAGRIRNIREYVQEGRKVVCKVLRIDKNKGHIDLSLRRVNERQRIEKNQALKQERKAENLLAHIAKEHDKKPEAFYEEVAPAILKRFDYIHEAFQAIVEDDFSLEELGIPYSKEIEELVKERIKPTEVQIEGRFTIETFAENGVNLVAKAISEAQSVAEPAEIRYLGGGHYRIRVRAEEYKDAEKRLKSAIDLVQDSFKKIPASTVKFERTDE